MTKTAEQWIAELRERERQCLVEYESADECDRDDRLHWWDDWRLFREIADAISQLTRERGEWKGKAEAAVEVLKTIQFNMVDLEVEGCPRACVDCGVYMSVGECWCNCGLAKITGYPRAANPNAKAPTEGGEKTAAELLKE
jgi:hypothetical protein